MLSKSTILKSNWIVMKPEEAVVINSNERMAAKIEEISSSLISETEEGFSDAFSEGIKADQVAALLSEDEESGNVIKKEQPPVNNGPVPEEMIAEAKEEIERMRSEAQKEINMLRDNVMAQALEEGRKAGYNQGYQEGMVKISELETSLVQQIQEKERLLGEDYKSKLMELEPALIETLTGIYEHIFDVDMSEHRNIILHLISNTLHRVEGGENYIIRVSKEDFPFVSMQKQSVLEKCVTSNATLEVVEDMTLTKNECLIETDSGIYDCGVGTELKELRKQLKLLSYAD